MQSSWVISMTGADGLKTPALLVEAVREAGGRVISRETMRLEGQLAVMARVEMDRGRGARLAAELMERFPGTVCRCVEAADPSDTARGGRIITLEVKCRNQDDPEGNLRSALAELDCRLEQLEGARLPVIGLGETVFSAKCAVRVPAGWQPELLAEEIEGLLAGARVQAA